eukprot:Rhum_TRINITY_DN14257_c14_g1::Rhum_TRINITY_DN14257_c14_g1_i1::g.76105::m.76105
MGVVGWVAWAVSNASTQAALCSAYDWARVASRGQPTVYFYHSPDDAVSDAVAQQLKAIAASFPQLRVVGRTVPGCPTDARLTPKAQELKAWNYKDTAAVARYVAVDPMAEAVGAALEAHPGLLAEARRALVLAEAADSRLGTQEYLRVAPEVGTLLRSLGSAAPAEAAAVQAALGKVSASLELLLAGAATAAPAEVEAATRRNRSELERYGHWGNGVLYFQGQFFWGLNRLKMLEERLHAVTGGAAAQLPRSCMSLRTPAAAAAPAASPPQKGKLEVWLSPRSPYSYILMEKLYRAGSVRSVNGVRGFFLTAGDVEVLLHPILPIAMRGFSVPVKKKLSIFMDAARIAHRLDIPFGFVCDPLGEPARNILRVVSHLQRHVGGGSEFDFFRLAMKVSWAENMPLLTEGDLQTVASRCGVDPAHVTAALNDDGWEAHVEASKNELEKEGQWGVPAVRCCGDITWGQDRMWVVQQWMGDATAEPDS